MNYGSLATIMKYYEIILNKAEWKRVIENVII